MKKHRRSKKKTGLGFKLILAVFILFALATAVHFVYNFILNWDKLNVSKIEIKGTSALNSEYVKKLVDLKKGANIFSYKLDKAVFQQEQWIENAWLKRIYPDKILVKIKERVPAAMFIESGRKFVITVDNKVVRSIASAEKIYKIPVWGDYLKTSDEKRGEIMAFLKDVRTKENAFYEGIRSFSMDGGSLKINMDDYAVLFGEPVVGLVSEKLKSVGDIVKDAAAKGQELKYIDLSPFTKKMRSAIIKLQKGDENNK
ncbi:FtsQ-type POTRA domain-containing protein [bacterium]|nr:FtsQ-type POTRA domain-containing protein [bacterium]MBU3955065.1 FtsQ-type POTRA domain-containing protein [bacterium]MBU4134007.1 FtsQ-type POTRA domain-containing protein [bacterium]